MTVVIFEHGRERVSAGVRRVIVSAVVVHGPIEELKITVRAVAVQVEEIRESKFAESQLQAPLREFAKQGKRSACRIFFTVTQGNNLMPHKTRNVRRFAECWISDYIEVRKPRQAKGLSNSMAPGLLNIAEQLREVCQTQTGIQGEDARTGVLCFR